MEQRYYDINEDIVLVQTFFNAQIGAPPVKTYNKNLIAVLDCSGSMSGDLRLVGDQLKQHIATSLSPGDTFTLVWFSGKHQFGTVLERYKIEGLVGLKTASEVIDKWIKPVGLTGFVEPLEEVKTLVNSHEDFRNFPTTLLFMSDGMDNQWPRDRVIKAFSDAGAAVSSTIVVEYGYYADRNFLAQMAASVGGYHVVAKDFTSFAPVLERAFSATPSSQKAKVTLGTSEPLHSLAWIPNISFDSRGRNPKADIQTFEPFKGDDGSWGVEVLVDGATHVYHLASQHHHTTNSQFDFSWVSHLRYERADAPALRAIYAAIALFSVRVKPELVKALLKVTGDVHLIHKFTNCFGKQAYTDFQDMALARVSNPPSRWLAGYNPAAVPADDDFCVIEFLRLLSEDEDNRVLMDSPEFVYKAISRARTPNADALKFTKEEEPDGFPVSKLVFNESRPNISMSIVRKGTVALRGYEGASPSQVDTLKKAGVPDVLSTQTIRNYAIIQDGLLNVASLPVSLTAATLEKIDKRSPWFINTVYDPVRMVVDLSMLPIVNRKMVKDLELGPFLLDHYKLLQLQAAQKVFADAYKAESAQKGTTRTSEGLVDKYGQEAAAWLKERGITDHGFSPRGKSVEATDYYMGKVLHVGFTGLSDLPSVKEAREKLAKATEKKPATIGALMLQPYIEQLDHFVKNNEGRDKVIRAWVDGQQFSYRSDVRKLQAKLSQDMICVILGQNWFGRNSLDPIIGILDTPDGRKIGYKVEQREIEIKL